MAGMLEITIRIPDSHGPAFKSAVDEMSDTLGTRLESQHRFDKEEALTHAAASFGVLRAAVSEQVAEGNRYYA